MYGCNTKGQRSLTDRLIVKAIINSTNFTENIQ